VRVVRLVFTASHSAGHGCPLWPFRSEQGVLFFLFAVLSFGAPEARVQTGPALPGYMWRVEPGATGPGMQRPCVDNPVLTAAFQPARSMA
jgi:hypothetical protein